MILGPLRLGIGGSLVGLSDQASYGIGDQVLTLPLYSSDYIHLMEMLLVMLTFRKNALCQVVPLQARRPVRLIVLLQVL